MRNECVNLFIQSSSNSWPLILDPWCCKRWPAWKRCYLICVSVHHERTFPTWLLLHGIWGRKVPWVIDLVVFIAECIWNSVDVVALFWRALFFNSRYQRYHHPFWPINAALYFDGQKFFVYSWCFMLWSTAIASTTRTQGKTTRLSLWLGIAKVAEHCWALAIWQR